MTKKECSEVVLQNIRETFESRDWNKKSTGSASINFEKNNEDKNVFGMSMSFLDYNPTYIMRFVFYIKHQKIINLCKLIGENIELIPVITSDTDTIVFSILTFEGLLHQNYMPDMETESEIVDACKKMLEFTVSQAFPYLEKINDIKEIDKVINGENAWADDWRKEFNLGGNFNIKRFIIAYLVGGVEHLDLVNERDTVTLIEYNKKENLGEYNGDYKNDVSHPVGYTLHYLRSLPDIHKI